MTILYTMPCQALGTAAVSSVRDQHHRRASAVLRSIHQQTKATMSRAGLIVDGRHAEILLPFEREAAGLALEAELRVLGELLHRDLLGLHDGPAGVRAVGGAVAARLAREAAVGVALGGLVVALERVEVLVVTRLLRVPLVEAGGLGLEAPDVVPLRDVEHLRGLGADLAGRARSRGGVADGGRGEGGEHRVCRGE